MKDVGTAALESIFKHLLIDEEWSTHGERSFSWIAHRLQQTVSASKIFEDDGIHLARLTASSAVVKNVQANEADVLRQLAKLNRHAIGSAYSFDPSAREVGATTVAYVHDETADWRPSQFGTFAITQLCIAESEADFIADVCAGSVAIATHKENGLRTTRDDMLNVLDATFAQDGLEKSRFENSFEFETIAEMTKHSANVASLGGSKTGVALEMPFDNYTSIARFATEKPHRRAGFGLDVRLHLPMEVTSEDADRITAVLNRAEQDGYSDTTHYGAWCWNDWPNMGRTIAYKMFMPNFLCRPGISQDVAYSMAKRGLWSDGFLNTERAKETAWERLAERYGLGRGDD